MDIDGKKVANNLLESLKKEIALLKTKPSLAVVLVGNNPASETYIRMKQKACLEIGIHSQKIHLPLEITQNKLSEEIKRLNQDPHIDGILIQMPLPSHIDEKKIIELIDPRKDVDGFHPINLGRMMQNDERAFLPCTPHGIVKLLQAYDIPVEGKHVVIVGRSNIVGRPLANLLSLKREGGNATVTLAHSLSENLTSLMQSGDILIGALGKPRFIKKEMVKKGAVVIDVGITKVGGIIEGDVDYDNVKHIASYITPVPGGVGPMTIAMLLSNTLKSHLFNQKGID